MGIETKKTYRCDACGLSYSVDLLSGAVRDFGPGDMRKVGVSTFENEDIPDWSEAPRYESRTKLLCLRCARERLSGFGFEGILGPPSDSHSNTYERTVPLRPLFKPHKILRNMAKCLKCGETLESKRLHDFRSCRCGALRVDGGHVYLRRLTKQGLGENGCYEELSEFVSSVEFAKPEPDCRLNKR